MFTKFVSWISGTMNSQNSRDAPLSEEEIAEEECRQECLSILEESGFNIEDMEGVAIKELKQITEAVTLSKNESKNSSMSSDQSEAKSTKQITKVPQEEFIDDNGQNQTTIDEDNQTQKPSTSLKSHKSPEPGKTPSSEKSPKTAVVMSNIKEDSDVIESLDSPPSPLSPPIYELKHEAKATSALSTHLSVSNITPRSTYSSRLSLGSVQPKRQISYKKVSPFLFVNEPEVPLDQFQKLEIKEHDNTRDNFSEEMKKTWKTILDIQKDEEKFDQIFSEISKKLYMDRIKIMSCIDCSNEKDEKYWGPPIKVIHSGRSEQIKCDNLLGRCQQSSGSTYLSCIQTRATRDLPDRAAKRKATSKINDDNNHYKSDLTEDEFFHSKKGKYHGDTAEAKNAVNQRTKNEDYQSGLNEKSKDHDPDYIGTNEDEDDVEAEEFQNSHHRGRGKNQENFPRRIQPPNPSSEKNYKGPRGRGRGCRNKNKKVSLGEDEIKGILVNDDENEQIAHEDNGRSGKVSDKLGRAKKVLEKKNEEEKAINEKELKHREQVEKHQQIQKDERISRRLEEDEEKKTRQLEKDRKLQEQTDFYAATFKTKNAVTGTNYNSSFRRSSELNNDGEISILETNAVKINKFEDCPICGKSFPLQEVERHAANCDEFRKDEDVAMQNQYFPNKAKTYYCKLCDYFSDAEHNLQDHEKSCKIRAKNLRENRTAK